MVRDEKRFRLLQLEEDLVTLLTRNDPGAETVAHTLLTRDGNNARAAQVIERAEVERAEAQAGELLRRVREEPTGVYADQSVGALRAALSQRVGAELREQLTELGHQLEARAAHDASRSAIEGSIRQLQSESSSRACMVISSCRKDRERARELSRAPPLRSGSTAWR